MKILLLLKNADCEDTPQEPEELLMAVFLLLLAELVLHRQPSFLVGEPFHHHLLVRIIASPFHEVFVPSSLD